MRLLILKSGLLLLAGATYLVGQYYRGVWFENIPALSVCQTYYDSNGPFCHSTKLDFGWILIAAGTALGIVAILMLFATLRTWKKWLIFSAIFVPLAVLVVIYQLPMNMPVSEISRENGTKFLGKIYIFATLLIVGISRLRDGKGRVAGK